MAVAPSGPFGSISGSRRSVSMSGWGGRPAIGSSTSTTRPESRRSFTSSSADGRRSSSTGSGGDAPAGTFVFVEPGVKRTAFAEEAGTSILALGGMPREAYVASGFEVWAPITPLYQAGQYAEAADRGREVVGGAPRYPAPPLQPRLLREPRGPLGRTRSGTCGRPSSGPGTVRRRARMGKVRHRLRPDPRRPRVQGTRRTLGVRRFSSVARVGRVSFPNTGPGNPRRVRWHFEPGGICSRHCSADAEPI